MQHDKNVIFGERLAALRTTYANTLPDRLAALLGSAQRLNPEAAWADMQPVLEEIRGAAHMFAGSAASFGFAPLGESARALERRLKQHLQADGAITLMDVLAVQAAIEAMIASVHGGSQPTKARAIALITIGGEGNDSLAQRLEGDGYEVLVISVLADVARLPAGRILTAVLVRADGQIDAALALLEHVRQAGHAATPVVFCAREGGFAARYAASRAGAAGFLADPSRLADFPARLEALIAAPAFQAYRVLYVGADAPALADAAFQLRVEPDPSAILRRIEEFQPELLLLSAELEGFDAVDLARMVWQDEAHHDLGIFFTSRDPGVHRVAAARGVTDAYFIAGGADSVAVQARITPYLHDRRAGLRPPNRHDLGPCLARIAGHMGGAAAVPVVLTALAPALIAPPAKPRRKVLIVDDDRYLVAMLAHELEERGAEVVRAYSGEQGYTAAWQELPSAIISDVEMPNGTGDRMLLNLRANPRTRDIPVIVMTSRRWEDGRDYALEREMRGRLGAAAYLQKPVQVETLARELARL